MVSVGFHIGIDAQGNPGRLTLGSCQFLNHLQLGNGFHVEAEDSIVQGQVNLPIGFSYPGEHYFRCRETGFDSSLDFTAANAVCSQPIPTDNAEYAPVGIGFEGIMNLYLVGLGMLSQYFQRITQHSGIVVIEGRFNR
ncbi:MAG: hypothetical protein BWY72_02375 [Bacteroidetes bacterium ADurb.Bin416]|nr:MAG: hypothetical protein BWY72_02375 [Bacteroidetes bacterium ADurb.Bin416]